MMYYAQYLIKSGLGGDSNPRPSAPEALAPSMLCNETKIPNVFPLMSITHQKDIEESRFVLNFLYYASEYADTIARISIALCSDDGTFHILYTYI